MPNPLHRRRVTGNSHHWAEKTSVDTSKYYPAVFADRGVNYHWHAYLFLQELFNLQSIHCLLSNIRCSTQCYSTEWALRNWVILCIHIFLSWQLVMQFHLRYPKDRARVYPFCFAYIFFLKEAPYSLSKRDSILGYFPLKTPLCCETLSLVVLSFFFKAKQIYKLHVPNKPTLGLLIPSYDETQFYLSSSLGWVKTWGWRWI